MTPDQAREFVANNHRAVMITRRSTGGLQTAGTVAGPVAPGGVVGACCITASSLLAQWGGTLVWYRGTTARSLTVRRSQALSPVDGRRAPGERWVPQNSFWT